jgi:hypothetical protein
MKCLLLCTAIILALTASANAQELPFNKDDTESCNCVQTEWGTQRCNMACMRQPNPEVVAALRKRYSDLQDEDKIVVFDDGKHNGKQRYTVRFDTWNWHMACRLTLNPVRLSRCRIVHA